MLTSVELSALVKGADALARQSPFTYRLRVGLLAAPGFGFVIASVLLALTLAVALIALAAVTKSGARLAKVLWLPFAFAWVLIRSIALDRDFWQPLYGRAEVESEPPAEPYARLLQVARSVDRETGSACLELAVAARTGLDDTHPALADRLAAMDAEGRLIDGDEPSAAEALLESSESQLAADMDGEWLHGVTDWWHERHQAHQRCNARLGELEQAARSQANASDEFVPRGLEATELAAVVNGLASHERVRGAWIVRKLLADGDRGQPHFIVLIRLGGMVLRELRILQERADRCELPGSLIVLSRSSVPYKLSRKLRRTAGRLVFER